MTNINPKPTLLCPNFSHNWLPKLFPSLSLSFFLLNSLREYSPLTAHPSPVSHPAAWLFSSPLYGNSLLQSHQVICRLPIQYFTSVTVAGFPSKDPLLLHPSLGFCYSSLSLLLLLTLQGWLVSPAGLSSAALS